MLKQPMIQYGHPAISGSYQLVQNKLSDLARVLLGFLALFRGCELVEGRYSPTRLQVSGLELLALGCVLLDLLNR
jgi:hypothetical protein